MIIQAPAAKPLKAREAHYYAPLKFGAPQLRSEESRDRVSIAPRQRLPKSVAESVTESVEQLSHQGKKLGALAAVSIGSSLLPVLAAQSAVSVIPGPLFLPVMVGMMLAAPAGVAWAEQKLGIGKHIGSAIGTVAGAGVGLVNAAVGQLRGPVEIQPVELKKQAPTGAGPFRPLAQAALDKIAGPVQVRGKAVEIGELVGATAATMAFAYSVPNLVSATLGGPVGYVLGQTLVGPLLGLVVGGLAESTLGIGRAAGELVGRGLQAAGVGLSGASAQPVAVQEKAAPPSEPGALMRGFLKYNHLIGQPIIGFLVDNTIVGNRLLAREPIQTIEFQQRPEPSINSERLLKSFVSLAGINAPSGKEKPLGDELEVRLNRLSIPFERKPDGTIIATLAATPGQEDSPTVMLSAHQDTVAPTALENIIVGERRIHTNEKSILGADDRAGIAEILEGVETVLETGAAHPEVKLVFTVDEERGLCGASRLKPEDISQRPTLGYIVDALDVQDVHLTNDAVIVNPNSVKYNYSQEDPLVQVVFQSMANANLKPRPIPAPILTGAGSDANTPAFNSKHIRSIAVGAGERDMHTSLEYIKRSDLDQVAKHVVGYITNSCDLKVEGDHIVARGYQR